jgi:hypothetical protein
MNLGENRIEMRIPRSDWFLRDLHFPIPKPFLIEFITRSREPLQFIVITVMSVMSDTFTDTYGVFCMTVNG